MFNRTTKLTAVLVAAASIMSSVPAMAATRLDSKDGTIDKAISYKDGKYLYEGYRTDDDDNGVYYNAGDKDKKLNTVDTIGFANNDVADGKTSNVTKFGDKYVSLGEGSSDEYIVDLTSGKSTDDDSVSDYLSTAKTKVQNKLKKTDRYGKDNGEAATVALINNGRFENAWYEYSAATATETNAEVKGYTDGAGNYIDCSYKENIYAYQDGKTYKLENVGDKGGKDDSIVLNSITHIGTIGEDDKYIYRVISADITGAYAVTTNSAVSSDHEPISGPTYYVQKISKAKGSDTEKDAYLPKSVETYQIDATDKEVINNGDAHTAYTELMNYINSDKNAASNDKAKVEAAIVDGNIYVTRWDDEKVKTFKIALKSSEKVTYDKANDKKVGLRLAKKDSDKDHDAKAWDVDSNGTVWAINEGKIMKSAKCGDFETVYTCDRSMDALDVYDESNLIAWDKSGGVYTTVQEGSDAAKKAAEEIVGTNGTAAETTTTTPVVKTGWQSEGSTWYLYDQAGNKMTGWQSVGGKWYYMDPNTTAMRTGWVQTPDQKWYYMDGNGAMLTGWQLVGGKWYFMSANGDMQTGWITDGSDWYYMYADGSMASNTTINGWVLGASGAWIQ